MFHLWKWVTNRRHRRPTAAPTMVVTPMATPMAAATMAAPVAPPTAAPTAAPVVSPTAAPMGSTYSCSRSSNQGHTHGGTWHPWLLLSWHPPWNGTHGDANNGAGGDHANDCSRLLTTPTAGPLMGTIAPVMVDTTLSTTTTQAPNMVATPSLPRRKERCGIRVSFLIRSKKVI
jgi:hypothetical protein